jgi:2-dehydro-3-deoxyphosphogalactonate aldolase
MPNRFAAAMARLPLVAILRGLRPAEAPAILEALLSQGFVLIEIPLNSPDPLASVAAMRKLAPPEVFIGAGTVLRVADVERIAEAGGDLVVLPHADVAIIRAAMAVGLVGRPGGAPPTEGFAALGAGADGLKAFPAEMIAPAIVKAWRAVIPRDVPILPVGGVGPDSMAAYVAAGASGFGLGSALYRPGDSAERVTEQAAAFVAAWRAIAP